MTSRQSHLLKIFTGPHTGAEVLLGDGEFTIGSDDSADIILTDHLISPHHVRLTISGSEVSCATIETAGLLVDGTSVTGSDLQPFQYFTLGSTHLAIGPADQDWPVTTFPEFRLGGNPAETEPIEQSAEPVTEVAEAPPSPRRRVGFFLIPAIALLVLLCGVGFFLMTSSDEESDTPTESVAEQIRQAIRAAGISDESLKLEETDRGHHLTGFVDSKDTRRQLTTAIRAISRSVSVRLRDLETLQFLTADFLQRRRLDLEAKHGDQPGEIVISGELDDIAAWHAAKPKLTIDVPSITSVVDNVKTTSAAVTQQATPADAPPAAAKTPDRTDEDLDPTLVQILQHVMPNAVATLDPELGQPGPKSVAEIVKAVTKSEPDSSVLATLPRSYVPDDATIPLLYRSVSIGGERSITMNDGQKVFIGARLDNGYTITDIRHDRILVANAEGEKVHFLENQR